MFLFHMSCTHRGTHIRKAGRILPSTTNWRGLLAECSQTKDPHIFHKELHRCLFLRRSAFSLLPECRGMRLRFSRVFVGCRMVLENKGSLAMISSWLANQLPSQKHKKTTLHSTKLRHLTIRPFNPRHGEPSVICTTPLP